jgi:hypothetical protein
MTLAPDELDEMGPIDYLVVEFPGSRMTGKGLPMLVDLVDRGIIRIIDLVFVRKELDGSVRGVAIADLDKDVQLDLAVFEGPPRGSWARTTWTRPGARSRRGARPGSWSTRTAGRRRWPGRSGVVVASWWPAAGSRSRPCWPPWTPPRPPPKPRPSGRREVEAAAGSPPVPPRSQGR